MENITNDDYIYTRNLIDAYVNGLITFPELLDVVPATVNLASLLHISKVGFHDKSIYVKLATMLINHYHSRLSEVKNFGNEKQFKKLLTVKEVFFLTDTEHIERLLEGKEVSLGDEFRKSFTPYHEKLLPLLREKVLGTSRTKIDIMLQPYNELFNKEKYLKCPSGYLSPTGNEYYVDEKLVDYAETLASEQELFPVKLAFERLLFETLKKQVLESEEKTL